MAPISAPMIVSARRCAAAFPSGTCWTRSTIRSKPSTKMPLIVLSRRAISLADAVMRHPPPLGCPAAMAKAESRGSQLGAVRRFFPDAFIELMLRWRPAASASAARASLEGNCAYEAPCVRPAALLISATPTPSIPRSRKRRPAVPTVALRVCRQGNSRERGLPGHHRNGYDRRSAER